MIVPDIVKNKWKPQPTTVEQLKIDLQAEKVKTQELDAQLQAEKTENEITRLKLANAENRISILEQSLSSILSKLNI